MGFGFCGNEVAVVVIEIEVGGQFCVISGDVVVC